LTIGPRSISAKRII